MPARPNSRQPGGHAREILEISQQPLDIFELELRAEVLAEAPAQFFQNAPRALHVDLARHLDRGVVAVVAPAQGPAERAGVLLGARGAQRGRVPWWARGGPSRPGRPLAPGPNMPCCCIDRARFCAPRRKASSARPCAPTARSQEHPSEI